MSKKSYAIDNTLVGNIPRNSLGPSVPHTTTHRPHTADTAVPSPTASSGTRVHATTAGAAWCHTTDEMARTVGGAIVPTRLMLAVPLVNHTEFGGARGDTARGATRVGERRPSALGWPDLRVRGSALR